jgi:two-component system sensor histidine kinase CpxA
VRSLFTRILLWFLLASTITTWIVIVTSQWFASTNLLNLYFGGLLNAHLEQARDVYEHEGKAGLQRQVDAFERGFARGVHVTDGAGRDLLTGEDLSTRALQTERIGRGHGVMLTFARRQVMLTKASVDGRYRIFLPFGWNGDGPGWWRPQLWAGLLAVIAMCWVLAHHLSKPVRQLQQVVERFGAGDTTQRARSRRSDEIGRLAQSFDGMADRIDELVQGQRRLLLDISHELRSPLARLTIASDLLRSDPTDAASLAQIELETDRLNQLIGEILQAARPDTRENQRRFAPLRLDALLRDVIDTCRIEAAEGRRIDLEIATATPTMMVGDSELLRRAIENVLRNAVRYAPPNTAVDVRLATSAEAVVSLTIRDRGPGVPDAALPHVFLPFYRVDADRERTTGGVGLGLAIARRAIELHGGHISARNAAPGLEVTIELTGARQVSESSPAYSARSASTGFTDAARRAGT